MFPGVTDRQLGGSSQSMLTQGESVEVHALRKRGWSVSAIARHLKRDRKTVRAYLEGTREPGKRKPSGPDRFERFAVYCGIRFADDRVPRTLREVAV
jgi:transposase